MKLYFKIRDVRGLDIPSQKELIQKYVTGYCHLEKYGIDLINFVDHEVEESSLRSKKFVIGAYEVGDNANFDQIELKMKLYDVHNHFIIFMLL